MNILFASIMILNVFFTAMPQGDIAGTTIDCKPHYLNNYYLPAWVTNDTWYREMPQYTTGKAVFYAPGVMEGTARVRGMSLDGFKGGVATNSVSMMGKIVWLKRSGMQWEGPFLVVDVGQRNHAYYQATKVKSIVEVDFETAVEWGIVSRASNKKGYTENRWSEPNVEMWVGLTAPTSMPENPVIYSEWYERNADFCDGQSNRRWKIEDWMILNYADYEEQLSINTPSSISRQQEEAEMLQPIANKLKISYMKKIIGTMIPDKSSAQSEYVKEASAKDEIITVHILKGHETWTHLSLRYYGSTTEPYWRLIYEANIDLVGDDYHRIWGGMEIVIPALPADFSP